MTCPRHVSATSDDVVTQVIAVSNVNAAQLVPVLRPLMPQNAQLSAVTGANMLIISDRASNVNRMMRIVARIDQSGGADIDVIPLQSATAADTVRVLSSLVSQGGEGGGPNLHLVADDRSNSVLISGDPTMRLKIRALIANLDTPLDTGGETMVRYLHYAKAEDLAAKLKEQIVSNNPSTTGTVTRVVSPTNAATAATVSLAGGTGTIWADKETNALVITAPQRTMRALNAVIDKLDIRRAQVRGAGDHRRGLGRQYARPGRELDHRCHQQPGGGRRLCGAHRRRLDRGPVQRRSRAAPRPPPLRSPAPPWPSGDWSPPA